ncbi:MAG: CopD family protein [Flavobacteriales bacterium]|nr:CopD family protein [Flavobacteriales bacterium]
MAVLLFALAIYFGGTFHIVRLFVAHREAMAKWEPDRTILMTTFKGMERNALYFMNWPALITALVMGAWMIWTAPGSLLTGSTQVLLGYTAVLLLYQFMVHRTYRRAATDTLSWSTIRLRLFAHGITVLLLGLVMILMMRDELGWVAGVIGLLVIGGILFQTVASTGNAPSTEKDA